MKNYKRCRDCDKRLSVRNQYPSCHRRNQRVCKQCWNKRFYIAVKKHKYGLTKQQFTEMLAAQQNQCLICDDPIEGRKVCVDHDHLTGKVRGLLCNSCNFGIGALRDSSELCLKAATYLAGHGNYERKPSGMVHIHSSSHEEQPAQEEVYQPMTNEREVSMPPPSFSF